MNANVELMRKLGLTQKEDAATAELVVTDSEEETEGKCFGYLRGTRDRAVSLSLYRLREGDVVSLPYSWLGPTHFHPSRGIALLFAAGDFYGVRIRGRHLNTLLDEGMSLYDRGILRHRVTFIREVSGKEAQAPGNRECVVERIEIVPVAANETMKFLGLED